MMKHITRDEAFTVLPNERNVNINYAEHDFQFTRRWFLTRNQRTWSTFLPQKFSHDKPVRMIQIGIFEGMDLVWCFQNFLGHPDSRVIAIDPWINVSPKFKTPEIAQQYMDDARKRALHNLSPWKDKITMMFGYSVPIMQAMSEDSPDGRIVSAAGTCNLIVVDGDHRSEGVKSDLDLAIQLIEVGGWILCDDVRNGRGRAKRDHVQAGIDAWLAEGNEAKVKRVFAHRYCDCFERIK